ncbi:MAG TPA: flagellar hook-basal body protein [Fimbriimonadaceae bacterium]|nr:flagellar hook-basal body protein [Fimbriimonadaceae bacterium]
MNRGLYTAATGMSAAQNMLDVIANNLANVSTNGFKGDSLRFRDALEESMASAGRGIGQMSYGVAPAGEVTDFSMGAVSQTGNPLDVAITDSKGAFKLDNGQYTRDGAFRLNDAKELVDRDGNRVLDSSGSPITLDGAEIDIHPNGEIVVDGQTVATLGVYDGTFLKVGQNQFTSTDAKPTDQISIQAGAVEGSNVNPVIAMIQMIQLSRNFDMSQKTVQQHDELTQRLIQSLNS